MELPDDIFDTTGRVVLFPVRHHSPTAARIVRDLISALKPAAVLIEGPCDFNDRLDELALDHEPPIAIYSYIRRADDVRRGAYYPFCVYSPEWQAFQTARNCGAAVRFIDLPYAQIAWNDDRTNRYGDADFRRSRYVKQLCVNMGVESFDEVWDLLFELDASLTVDQYMVRAHRFCAQMRLIEEESRLIDRQREAFMAARVREAINTFNGPILVVTGGYHSLALHARLKNDDSAQTPVLRYSEEPGQPRGNPALRSTSETGVLSSSDPRLLDPPTFELTPIPEGEQRGIALTPYSYERLDRLTGYEAGMPNPGFYHRLWQDRIAAHPVSHRKLLFDISKVLRGRKQRVSSADLIAAESCATALAHLRGHGEVWRTDLVDGLTGALIKDELTGGGTHPLIDAIHQVLRGDARGKLADGTALPPLMRDIQRELTEHDLVATPQGNTVNLDLTVPADLHRSRLLHRLRVLGINGYTRAGGTDFASRSDVSRLWEKWDVRWSPDFDATSIEASRYGATLAEAVAARLAEQARSIERSAQRGALLLLDSSLAAATAQADVLLRQLRDVIRQDGEFLSVTEALGHLLYLFRYDDILGTTGSREIGSILTETFGRGLWLLEVLGQMIDPDGKTVQGIARLLETFEQCELSLALNRGEFVGVLHRVADDPSQGAALRGAATGAVWVLGEADFQRVRTNLRLFSDPEQLGDFLTGLFAVARENVQRQHDLILAIDELVNGYSNEQFLTAMPSLRLAFTYFTPREKHHMATGLLEALGIKDAKPLAALAVSPEAAARALALEDRVFNAVKQFGLRSTEPGGSAAGLSGGDT